MKRKLVAIILTGMMGLSLVACSKGKGSSGNETETTTEDSTAEVINMGGYTTAESPEITDDIQDICQKAFANIDGAAYEPVALVATQVVSGTNYIILCKQTPIIENPVQFYTLAYIYADLNGNAEVSEFVSSNLDTGFLEDGGWTETDSVVMTDDASDLFEQASTGLTGASYTPVALIATNGILGTTYRVLCETVTTTADMQTGYAIVTYGTDENGTTAINDIVSFTTQE